MASTPPPAPAPAGLPVRYAADIRTAGQCRGNLSVWRGIWRLALAGQPPDTEEGLEALEGGALAPTPCAVVLAHRATANAPTETRWFGAATRQYYCGDVVCVCVDWQQQCTAVPASTDLAVVAPAVGGAVAPAPSAGAARPLALQHDLLIRDAYLLLGESGSNDKDHCIKLELVAGKGVE